MGDKIAQLRHVSSEGAASVHRAWRNVGRGRDARGLFADLDMAGQRLVGEDGADRGDVTSLVPGRLLGCLEPFQKS